MKATFAKRVCLVLSVCPLLITMLWGCGGTEKIEQEIVQTISELETDFSDCMDFSVFVNDDDLNFDALEKYCDDDVFDVFLDFEDAINSEYASIGQLKKGGDFTSGLAGGLLGGIPFIGNALGTFTENEIKDDVLFDERTWRRAAKVGVECSDIQVAKDKKSAQLDIDITISIDHTKFSDSNILKVLDGLDGFADIKKSETISYTATMEKNSNGDWVLTRLRES